MTGSDVGLPEAVAELASGFGKHRKSESVPIERQD